MIKIVVEWTHSLESRKNKIYTELWCDFLVQQPHGIVRWDNTKMNTVEVGFWDVNCAKLLIIMSENGLHFLWYWTFRLLYHSFPIFQRKSFNQTNVNLYLSQRSNSLTSWKIINLSHMKFSFHNSHSSLWILKVQNEVLYSRKKWFTLVLCIKFQSMISLHLYHFQLCNLKSILYDHF